MNENCAARIRELHGLSEADAREIVTALEGQIEANRARAGQVPLSEATLRFAQEKAELHQRAAEAAARRVKIALVREADAAKLIDQTATAYAKGGVESKIKEAWDFIGFRRLYGSPGKRSNAFKALDAFLVGREGKAANLGYSVDARIKEYAARVMGALTDDLEKVSPKIGKVANDKRFNLNLAREMEAMADRPVTGDELAHEVAKVLDEHKEWLRLAANKEGADISREAAHVMMQNHNSERILLAGLDKWRAEILPLLDHARTFPEGTDAEGMLERIYTNIVGGVRGDKGGKVTPKDVAGRMSHSRVLHFKSADAWFTYNERFGSSDVLPGIVRRMEVNARNVALMQALGPDPGAGFNRLLKRQQKLSVGDEQPMDAEEVNALVSRFKAVSGEMDIPAVPKLAHFAQGLRNLAGMAKLGMAVINSFNDVVTSAGNARYNGKGFLSSYADTFKYAIQGRTVEEQRKIARQLGLFADSVLGDAARRFHAVDGVPGALSRMTRTYFKWNGLDWWTETFKRAHGLLLSNHLADHAGLAFKELPEAMRNSLEHYGIGSGAWDHIRGGVETVGDNTFINPEVIANADAANRLRMFFVQEVDYAVIHPGAREKSMLLGGTQVGTWSGEIARTVAQFKSFPMAMMTKAGWRSAQAGPGAMFHLILASTAFGYLSQTAGDFIKGRTQRDPLDYRTFVSAFTRGGGAGFLGDMVFGNFTQGRGLLEYAAGPVLGNLNELATVYSAAMRGDDAKAKAFRLVVDNLPFSNIWWGRTAANYLLIHHLQEAMNPGYLRRMEQTIRRETGQEYWLPPTSIIRHGGGFR